MTIMSGRYCAPFRVWEKYSLWCFSTSDTIARFPSVQDFASYSRLIKCQSRSAGKLYGTSGAKIGNAHLKWAFSEIAVLFLRDKPEAKLYVEKLTQQTWQRQSPFHLCSQNWTNRLFYVEKEKAVQSRTIFCNPNKKWEVK